MAVMVTYRDRPVKIKSINHNSYRIEITADESFDPSEIIVRVDGNVYNDVKSHYGELDQKTGKIVVTIEV